MKYIEESDTIELEFDKEKGVMYKYCVSKEIKENRLKLAKEMERKVASYQEIMQIGAVVEVKWTKDKLSNTNWSAGENLYFTS